MARPNNQYKLGEKDHDDGYRPHYCAELFDHMSRGYSFQTFIVGTVRDKDGKIKYYQKSFCLETIKEWIKKYPEFKRARDAGKLAGERMTTDILFDGMTGKIPKFNVLACIFALKSMYGMREDGPTQETDQVDKNLIFDTQFAAPTDYRPELKTKEPTEQEDIDDGDAEQKD